MIENPVQLATESSVWQQAAELTAILGFCTESRRSEWGRRMGEGDIVLCAVCNNIGMWAVSVIVLAIILFLLTFYMMLFSNLCWNTFPLVFTIRILLSLQEEYLLIWKQRRNGLQCCAYAPTSHCAAWSLRCKVYTQSRSVFLVNSLFFHTHVTAC